MMETVVCTIEHHAAMYGFLAREAIRAGLEGRRALSVATQRYGWERGARMAEYADHEHLEHTMETYALFKEWRPPQPGQCVPGESVKSPHYLTSVVRCEWAETWKKYDLLPYAKTYCLYVDKALVKGFNAALELDIPANLSFGDEYCEFNWGYDRSPEKERWLNELKTQIGEKYVRDFTFHTAHLYCCISRVLREELSEVGEQICAAGLRCYVEMFGEPYVEVLKAAAAENDWVFR